MLNLVIFKFDLIFGMYWNSNPQKLFFFIRHTIIYMVTHHVLVVLTRPN